MTRRDKEKEKSVGTARYHARPPKEMTGGGGGGANGLAYWTDSSAGNVSDCVSDTLSSNSAEKNNRNIRRGGV